MGIPLRELEASTGYTLDRDGKPVRVEDVGPVRRPKVRKGQKRNAAPVPEAFADKLREAGIPIPVTEHKFHPSRKWRMDFAWPEHRVCLEVEGGVWTRGRHTRGSGFLGDIEKYNAATSLGWRVLRCTPDALIMNETIDLIAHTLKRATATA